jgi:hypothetical protein
MDQLIAHKNGEINFAHEVHALFLRIFSRAEFCALGAHQITKIGREFGLLKG